jgi:hypothetical protein
VSFRPFSNPVIDSLAANSLTRINLGLTTPSTPGEVTFMISVDLSFRQPFWGSNCAHCDLTPCCSVTIHCYSCLERKGTRLDNLGQLEHFFERLPTLRPIEDLGYTEFVLVRACNRDRTLVPLYRRVDVNLQLSINGGARRNGQLTRILELWACSF